MNVFAKAALIGLGAALVAARAQTADQSLDGTWDTGAGRHYTARSVVPGLAEDPTAVSPGTLWYRRNVALPPGSWSRATLLLGGARFAPTVYVNGEKVGTSDGGMAPTSFELPASAAPGRTITLEIALRSLAQLDPEDASATPAADRWRSDISSSLWDHVALHFSGQARIDRIVPWTGREGSTLQVHWSLAGASGGEGDPQRDLTVQTEVLDSDGHAVAHSDRSRISARTGISTVPLNGSVARWSPEHPVVYRLRLELRDGAGNGVDRREINWGLKEFRTQGLRFVLNGAPVELRAGSVVWHRWLRDPEAHQLAFDPKWFRANIVERLKGLGANTLRFHLGLPPESFLDLCDREGVMVQMEWPFFHGIKSGRESMERQWRAWLDVGMHHPSVVLVHAWNETEGEELKLAWSAMDAVLPDYPPLVIGHRDVIHIHKYWWSLFENLGLYYDSASQFDHPIMVDEFGGDYLDHQGNPGAYPAVRESFLRFLGRDQTKESRLSFQAEANAKVAEYWRRLGAAGFSPFCLLSSPEDGNDWFLGKLAEANPKPVWAAMHAAWAQRSVSLEVWDRNYVPGQRITVPVYFFNDSPASAKMSAEVRVGGARSPGALDPTAFKTVLTATVPAHGRQVVPAALTLPGAVGEYRLEAELQSPQFAAHSVAAGALDPKPVISSWTIRTLKPAAVFPDGLCVGVDSDETELVAFLRANRLSAVPLSDPRAEVLIGSLATWKRLQPTAQGASLRTAFEAALNRGRTALLLDIGPRDLGQGYKNGDLGPLDGAPRISEPKRETDALFAGVRLSFLEAPEPESHFHPGPEDSSLWHNLPRESTWMWNGLRGGLVVPAADMAVAGLSARAFLALWSSRGADASALQSAAGEYYAYELAGFYAFSRSPKDKAIIAALRQKVKLLADDAPALQDRINPNAPIEALNLVEAYRASGAQGQAERLISLASCGKNLTRIPVVELSFGTGKGHLIVSQLLTAGRLRRGAAEPGLYGLRYDPAAEQFVLNLLARSLADASQP